MPKAKLTKILYNSSHRYLILTLLCSSFWWMLRAEQVARKAREPAGMHPFRSAAGLRMANQNVTHLERVDTSIIMENYHMAERMPGGRIPYVPCQCKWRVNDALKMVEEF
jgi:hypothetical protein